MFIHKQKEEEKEKRKKKEQVTLLFVSAFGLQELITFFFPKKRNGVELEKMTLELIHCINRQTELQKMVQC